MLYLFLLSIKKKKYDLKSRVNKKSLKCSTWMQSLKRHNDLCSLPRQSVSCYGNPVYTLTSNAEEAEVEQPLTVWITTNWKILKEMGIPDHLSAS